MPLYYLCHKECHMLIRLVKTSKNSFFADAPICESVKEAKRVITVDPSKTQQRIIGFGGAFTESAAHVYMGMDESIKKKAIELYFGDGGLRYNLGRLTIGSCDFSTGNYDYCSKDDLSDFSLKHEEKEIFPFLKAANEMKPLSLMASSWSPLAKWKTNGQKCHGGKLKKSIYEKEAEYVANYVKAMGVCGFNVNSITVQNEPLAKQIWESCLFNSRDEAELAILLHAALPDTHIYIWDHNRDKLVYRADKVLSYPGADEAAYGVAYHWYDGNQNAEIGKAKKRHKDKHFIFSEGCVELLGLDPKDPSSAIGRFESGIRYARNYILDMSYGSEGFLDWNLLLDFKGGPNHVGNFCEAPIMSDGHSLLVNSSYYAIKHLSYFIKPGAEVLSTDNDGQAVIATAAKNPDGSIVVVMLNEGEGVDVALEIEKKRFVCYLNHNEIATVEYLK